ncbi:N-acetylmuramoyl-L-alanine amidase [Planctomycetota bacterium]|nr:N-acetylmuramoyl-L-alanine amidase [Planctomycetota bacterium]
MNISTITRTAATCCAAFIMTMSLASQASAKVAYPSVVWDEADKSNYSSGRYGGLVDSFAIHTVEGSYAGAVSWFNNPKSNVSSHYVIDKNGDATQMVDSWDTAWTTNYYNSRSISFEMAGYAGQASTWYYQSWEPEYGTTYNNLRPNVDKLANICAFFMQRDPKNGTTYDIPLYRSEEVALYHKSNGKVVVDKYLNQPGFVGHYQVTPWYKTDPGIYFPWDDLMLFVDSYLDNDKNIYWPVEIPTPEPSSLALFSIAGLALIRRKK